jgi:hypothetical protein
MNLKQLIREVLEDKSCCTATKPTKAPILNENLAPREILSEGLKYHIDNKKPLTEHVYRAGSTNYFNLWAEARALYTRGILDFSGDDLAILTETQLGEFGYYEGKKVPLDFIMEEENIEEINITSSGVMDLIRRVYKDAKLLDFLNFNTFKDFVEYIKTSDFDSFYEIRDEIEQYDKQLAEGQDIDEAKAKPKKKNPPIGKPMRGGSKKFYVYVKAPGGKIKKVSFGQAGMSAKINNPKARAAFAARHDCKNKKDRTKASYWSCRLPRYAKLLGLKSNFSGFW